MRLTSFCSLLLSEIHRSSITQPFWSRPRDGLIWVWTTKVPPPKLSCYVLIFLSSGWSLSLIFQFYKSVVLATHLCACSVIQSSPTLCDPMGLPGSSVHGILRQEYWRGLPFPSPVDLPIPGIDPGSPALQADALPLSHWGSCYLFRDMNKNVDLQTPVWNFYRENINIY